MVLSKRHSLKSGLVKALACGVVAAGQLVAAAQQLHLESAGLRFGVSANNSGAAFHQLEAAAKWQTPWSWDLGREFWLRVQAAVSAGWLGDPGHDAFISSAGPVAVFGRGSFPLTLEGGLSPTFIGRADFGSKDLGSNAQFTSHAGVNVHLGPAVRLSYRFQHMSNAGLSTHNPGLNLHMFGVSYEF